MSKNAVDSREVLLSCRALRVEMGGRVLLDDVSLSQHAGELTTIIGPNGAGKTSLVKALLGIIPLSSGEVWRARNLRIGYVPQKLNVDPALPLSVERFLCLRRDYGGDEIVAALLRTGIEHLRRRSLHALSGGEFQRVLLARALIVKPRLLILDEPLQALDLSGEMRFYDLLEEVRAESGCGILMISHDLHMVMAKTDDVLCLNQHICCRGTPSAVMVSPEYIKIFGSRTAETLALYRHQHDHAHAVDGSIQTRDESLQE